MWIQVFVLTLLASTRVHHVFLRDVCHQMSFLGLFAEGPVGSTRERAYAHPIVLAVLRIRFNLRALLLVYLPVVGYLW